MERIGADNVFIHLDTFHMNMEEKGIANGVIAARNHLKYMHMSESDRGTPGCGNVAWDEVFSALAAIGFKGVLTLESFAAMPRRWRARFRPGGRLRPAPMRFSTGDCHSCVTRQASTAFSESTHYRGKHLEHY